MFNLFNHSINNENKDVNAVSQLSPQERFETLQKARQDLVGEIQAIIEYDNHLHNITDILAKGTWENIKSEELKHVGELLGLINYLDPSQKQYVQAGLNEFMNRLKNNGE